MSALVNPFFLLGLSIAIWASWRLGRWLASGGRLPLRGRRGAASALGVAGLSAQTFYQPAATQIVEAEEREALRREEDEEGDPPAAGLG